MGYTPWVQRVVHNLVTEQQPRKAKQRKKMGRGEKEKQKGKEERNEQRKQERMLKQEKKKCRGRRTANKICCI